jgi:hypothetical protein
MIVCKEVEAETPPTQSPLYLSGAQMGPIRNTSLCLVVSAARLVWQSANSRRVEAVKKVDEQGSSRSLLCLVGLVITADTRHFAEMHALLHEANRKAPANMRRHISASTSPLLRTQPQSCFRKIYGNTVILRNHLHLRLSLGLHYDSARAREVLVDLPQHVS